jgi:hypothetical protein
MSQLVEIKCINKSDRSNPHERITHVGGVNPNGSNWRLPQQDAIAYIENDTYRFYVHQGGRTAYVIVAVSQYGHKYLKTEADGAQPDNLLSLMECSW